MVGAVSAADNISEDTKTLEITQNNIHTTDNAGSFSELENEINESGNTLEITKDYTFNNETDNTVGISIAKDNFTINGNNCVLDTGNQSRIFYITGDNVTISNLILMNGHSDMGGAIFASGKLILNNVTFINNSASQFAGAIAYKGALLECNNSRFIDNYAETGASLYFIGNTVISNSYVTSTVANKFSQIRGDSAVLNIDNTTFANIVASYSPALHLTACDSKIRNSRFINLTAEKTAGAIGIKFASDTVIENCEFINTASTKNAGAIYADIAGSLGADGNLTIFNTRFENASSGYGGAVMQLGGHLIINNSEFKNDNARLGGGAVYVSFVDAKISNSNFTCNGVDVIEGYPTYGGAIFCDYANLTVTNSRFTNSTAFLGNAIYARDTAYNISKSNFINNTNAIYTDFDREAFIADDNILNNETVFTNNTFYLTIITGTGMELTLTNNTFNVATLPSRYDSRDWGWVSEVKNQGQIEFCWTFGMTGTLESALLKACGIKIDLSQNNMGNTMLRYSTYGHTSVYEPGMCSLSASYLLSWLGAFSEDYDSYDELGKISPVIATGENIHVQDVMFTSNFPQDNGTYIKSAIFNYGSVDASFYGQSTIDDVNPYFNDNTSAQYVDTFYNATHEISIVGWDDHYSRDNFLITPLGDGAWIVKNSYGKDWGDNGMVYVSYYDKTLSVSTNIDEYATAIIIENTVPYNKNYQHDIIWGGKFISGENLSYVNEFKALDDDLIAGVGTYFERSSINYTVSVYVNDQLKLTQSGVSPYFGFHTIKLDKYIPVRKGDYFYAVITSDSVPIMNLSDMRTHSYEGISWINRNGNWSDLYEEGMIAVMKIYTVADDSKITGNKNVAVDYAGGNYFSVRVVTADGHAVGAGEKVKFTINGKTTTVTTDKNGVAKIKITDLPKTYTIKTTYNGKTYTNTVKVKQVLSASKVTVKKTAKKFTLKAKLKINGKLIKGKYIKFKFNGKTYKVKTNAKGIAQKTFNKKFIKKLKKGKTYTVKVTYLKDTIKTIVKVK